MKKTISFYSILLSIFSWGCGSSGVNMESLQLNRFEAEILEFERENQNKGVQQGAIVFLGGAPIRQWHSLTTDFQGMPVKNRGFGDATLREINHYYSRLTDPFQAELMVLYAGENDIVLGATPQEVLQTFGAFQKQMAMSHRTTRTIYIGIMPSPAHWSYWPQFQEANNLIKNLSADQPSLKYVDLSAEMLGADGKPIQQLFEADGLTLNQAGYARLASVLGPELELMF